MDLIDFANGSIWAIHPGHLAGMLSNLPTNHAALNNAKATGKKQGAKKQGAIAVIPIVGPLSKRYSFFSMLFGGTSMVEIGRLVTTAAADDDVSAIVLDIDSPGGTVAGTEELSSIIFDARSRKPIIGFSDGTLASAAYWIGSAAHKLVISKSAGVGSIGVVVIHTDYSEQDAKAGVRHTVLTAGKYKAVGNSAAPLSEEDRKIIQDRLEYTHSVFIDAVAKNLDLPAELVRSTMADGGVHIGDQAVKIGMAHQTGTFSDAVRLAESMAPLRVISSPVVSKEKRTPELSDAGTKAHVDTEKKATPQQITGGGDQEILFDGVDVKVWPQCLR